MLHNRLKSSKSRYSAILVKSSEGMFNNEWPIAGNLIDAQEASCYTADTVISFEVEYARDANDK